MLAKAKQIIKQTTKQSAAVLHFSALAGIEAAAFLKGA